MRQMFEEFMNEQKTVWVFIERKGLNLKLYDKFKLKKNLKGRRTEENCLTWCRSHLPVLHRCPFTFLVHSETYASPRKAMILSTFLRISLLDTLTRGEGCSCLSRHITDVLIRIPPLQHPVMLHVKKLPVHHKHPAFYVPRLRGERKERDQSSLKHKLTALRRLTLHQRRDVPDTQLNFHNKVTPPL